VNVLVRSTICANALLRAYHDTKLDFEQRNVVIRFKLDFVAHRRDPRGARSGEGGFHLGDIASDVIAEDPQGRIVSISASRHDLRATPARLRACRGADGTRDQQLHTLIACRVGQTSLLLLQQALNGMIAMLFNYAYSARKSAWPRAIYLFVPQSSIVNKRVCHRLFTTRSMLILIILDPNDLAIVVLGQETMPHDEREPRLRRRVAHPSSEGTARRRAHDCDIEPWVWWRPALDGGGCAARF